MNYSSLELEIAKRLHPLMLEGCEVSKLPDTQAAYNKTLLKPRVYVAYGGSKYDLPQSTNEISQHERVNILCYLQTRALDGGAGMYWLMERVKYFLLGFQPSGVGRMYLINVDFEKYEENIWHWIVTFECKKMEVQRFYDDEPDGPQLKSITSTTTIL